MTKLLSDAATNAVVAATPVATPAATPVPTLVATPAAALNTAQLLHDGRVAPSESEKLPDDVASHLENVGRTFQDVVNKFLRAGSHREKPKDEVEVMRRPLGNDATGPLRYPPGPRPFKTLAAEK